MSDEPTYNELIAVFENAQSVRSIGLTEKRIEVILRALRIAANHVALPPIPHASDIEKRIVGKLVADLLAAGHNISVHNGGDTAELFCSIDADEIYKELAASDQDELVMRNNATGTKSGWVRLVWGNGVDVISDYTTNLEKVLADANALACEIDS